MYFLLINVYGVERLCDELKYNVCEEGGMNLVVFSIIYRGLEIQLCCIKFNKEGLNLQKNFWKMRLIYQKGIVVNYDEDENGL